MWHRVWDRTQATLLGDERSHHCPIPAPLALRKIFSGPVHFFVVDFLASIIFARKKIKTVSHTWVALDDCKNIWINISIWATVHLPIP